MADLNIADTSDREFTLLEICDEIADLEDKIPNINDESEKTKHKFRVIKLEAQYRKIVDNTMF